MKIGKPKTWIIVGCIGLVLAGISFWAIGWPRAVNIPAPLILALIGAGIAKASQC